ncbi:sensor histidine kinase [Clostridium sp. D2Q-14]|uniref:sensor histidine kinase n=1 Tax=Anaeromonas gelatinilytica TaxID=2683194 RepID=UPI00193B7456|nr:sensor histidine kinase [Anaeromonas gelatinilytica]MBS4534762.1 sensor histidine kinase [Anaeromonas gelatinilytica]
MDRNINVFLSYVKERRVWIYVYIIFASIFLIVFYIYSLPLETVLYSTLICGYFSLIFIILDIYKYFKNYKSLLNIKENITIDSLPTVKTLEEKMYQDMIAKLYQDKKELITKTDQKNTELVEYFTLWTHQIKTPLSGAYLLVDLNNCELYEDISNQLFEIEQYVDMALQYLRLENMFSDLRLEEYSLLCIVKKAVKTYSKIFIHKGISLKLSEKDVRVITDEKWLLFVLKQILSNSLKYTHEGYIDIYIEEEKKLVIKDTGIGISKGDIPRIFERGFTGYNGRINKKSTGLGLYLCKEILDKLNHDICIYSEIGIGTTVKIDLSSIELEI